MNLRSLKYIFAAALIGVWLMGGCATGRRGASDVTQGDMETFERAAERLAEQTAEQAETAAADTTIIVAPPPTDSTATVETAATDSVMVDSVVVDSILLDSTLLDSVAVDSVLTDSMLTDSMMVDTAARRTEPRTFLEQQITGDSEDSLVFDVRSNMLYFYNKGNVVYGDLTLAADHIEMNVDTRNMASWGMPIPDSVGAKTRGKFTQGAQNYEFDTLRYNLKSRWAKIRRTSSQQGEGYMIIDAAKKHPDNTTDMAGGRYTTCNHLDHPHFYISMNKGRLIPNKKIIFGMAHFVLEDVPLYFPFVPFGFFPLATGPSSGFIMPSFGEEYNKGFFLRGAGYYFRLSDHVDATVTGSIYTLGSWDARISTQYMQRYKFRGNLSFDYAHNVMGEKGSADYISTPTYSLRWSHQQDAKARPGTTFSASVDFTSSGHSKYAATNVNDMLKTQTNSSISYGKNWQASGRFPGANFSASLRSSQNSQQKSVTLTFPSAAWSVPKFKPFKRVNGAGNERWYEKISLSYSGNMDGTVTTKEDLLFKQGMMDNFRTGVKHSIPVSMSWTLLDYINFTPNATYNEVWFFRQIDRQWDQAAGEVRSDTTNRFNRAFDYSFSASMGTKVYGMFTMKNTNGWLRAVRHVITPSASLTYRPDFTGPQWGYRRPYQTDASGATATYTPYEGMYGVPGGSKSASLSFSLQQNLEAKVRDGDTVTVKKIIDNLSISSGYDFIRPQFKLNNFGVSFSTPIYKEYALKFSATLDPYQVDSRGTRIDRYTWKDGKLPRLTSFSTSFGWNLNKTLGYGQPINDPATQPLLPTEAELEMMDPYARAEAEYERRRVLMNTYYDFGMPYNLGINYGFSYSNNGVKKAITQTMTFNGSVTLTPFQSDGNNRWGVTFSGGYDFGMRKPTLGQIAIVRDLHCFTMSLNWVPIGYQRMWAFNIRIKAAVLQDIKYDKSRYGRDDDFR